MLKGVSPDLAEHAHKDERARPGCVNRHAPNAALKRPITVYGHRLPSLFRASKLHQKG